MFLRFVAFKGFSLISKLIRFYTRSEYSHIAYLLNDSTLIECWKDSIFKTVKWDIVTPAFRHHKDKTPVEIWSLKVDKKTFNYVNNFMLKLGKNKTPYDYKALFGFVLKYKTKENGKYFCSEGCIAPLVKAFNWNKINPSFVSPANFVAILQAAGGKLEKKGIVMHYRFFEMPISYVGIESRGGVNPPRGITPSKVYKAVQ